MQGKCLSLQGMENAKNHLHNCRDWKMQGTRNTSRKYGWQLQLPSFIIRRKLLNIRRIKNVGGDWMITHNYSKTSL